MLPVADIVLSHWNAISQTLDMRPHQINLKFQCYFGHFVMVPTCSRYGAATPECYIAGTSI